MATPNAGSIPQPLLREVTPGLEQPLESIGDLVCRRRTDVEALKGTAPFLTSEMTTSKGANRDLAPGETARPSRAQMGEVAYNAKRQTGFSEIYDESSIQASAFDLDLVEHFLNQAQQDANTAADLKLWDVLNDTDLNLEFDATSDGNGPWDDTSNGTPLQDIVDMSTEVPHATQVIIGRKVVDALRKHPETMGEVINYTGGGVMTRDHIQDAVASVLGINADEVYLLTDFTYDEAPKGEEFDLGFLLEDVFWLGAGYDLQLFEPDHARNRYSASQRVEEAAKEQVLFHRYVDFIRHVKENAITLTNGLS